MKDLILFQRQADTVDALPLAAEMKEKALVLANRVGKVTNAREQQAAVEAQVELKTYLDTVESSRKFFKAPILAAGQELDALAQRISSEVKSEMMRVSALVGTFQQEELARVRALEASRLRDLAEVERKRQIELSKAATVDDANRIQEKFNQQAAQLPVAQAARVEGQSVRPDWDVELVGDGLILATNHRDCVDISMRVSVIKAKLNANVEVKGVIATRITKAGVRVPKGKTIEV